MRNVKILAVCGALVAVAIPMVLFVHASAQSTPMTEDQMNRIRTNCVSTKNTLTQLHASDALLRVNRGQIYLSMTTKLMNRFNTRANNNSADVKDLTGVTSSYESTLLNFQNDYKAYEEQLSSVLKIDCSKEPVAFYDAVTRARTKRAQVHNDVLALHQYIDTYKTTFDTFVTQLNVGGGTN